MANDNSNEQKDDKSFWNTTIGTITKITALITAITGLILAVKPYLENVHNGNSTNLTGSSTNSTDKNSNITKPDTGATTHPQLHIFTPPEIRDFLDAAVNGNVDVLKSDLELGINANIILNDDRTALENAVLSNKPEAAKTFLEHEAYPNIKINGNSYMLIEAAYGGYNEIADLLIKHKADINCRKQDGFGITPLMFACIRGNAEIVKSLIDDNADPNLKSMQQSTALDYATALSSPTKEQVIAILKSVGALSGH